MEPVTVKCDQCGASTFVHNVRYKYREDGKPGLAAAEHVLVAIERDIECPVCGRRTQLERLFKP
jgi:endogenous inhibitor of DNA gyrase (YacG/DUF329 family)